MTVSGETSPLNQISEWWCHPNGYGVYFNTPYTIEPESTKTASLTNIPNAYDVYSWKYRYLKDGVITSQMGLGSVAPNLLMPPYADWVNLHWELKQQTYRLTINVKKILPEIKPIDLPSRCGEPVIYDGALQGAQITVTDADDTANVVCSGTSNSDGNLTCPIWILQGALNITATKSVGGLTPETYSLQCPNSNVYVYNPNPSPVKGDSRTADIGLQTGYKDGWVSAIDSDIFAGRLNVIVPAGPTDNLNSGQTPQGFAKTLINSSGNTDRYLGFAFSETGGVSNSPNDPKKIFETRFGITLGGNAYNLRGNSKEHDSEWLKNFTFTPPSGAVQLSTIGNSFKANTVYKISQDDHGTIELPNSYRITDGTGVSILYFEGDLVIRNNVTNITPGNGRLLVIVNGSVTISESVGTTLTYPAGPTNYMSQDPHIMVGIIASEEIIFKSISGTKTETNRDKMIMVSAPLIAKNSMNSASGITFGRDLYHDNNATMPAESAKEYNKYLYLLTSLEREKSQDNLYFTGVTTYDLDWEYIY